MQAAPARRYRVGLITAESEASLFVRHRRLIRFPQLTMPLLAAWTPEHWEVSHTDEIVQRVDFSKRADLVGITANTPAAPHAYALAREFRRRGVAVAIGGPHATLLPEEVAEHADAVVVGEGELVWPELLADFERGELKRIYASCALPDLKNRAAVLLAGFNCRANGALTNRLVVEHRSQPGLSPGPAKFRRRGIQSGSRRAALDSRKTCG